MLDSANLLAEYLNTHNILFSSISFSRSTFPKFMAKDNTKIEVRHGLIVLS
jgi:hypothetical protein